MVDTHTLSFVLSRMICLDFTLWPYKHISLYTRVPFTQMVYIWTPPRSLLPLGCVKLSDVSRGTSFSEYFYYCIYIFCVSRVPLYHSTPHEHTHTLLKSTPSDLAIHAHLLALMVGFVLHWLCLLLLPYDVLIELNMYGFGSPPLSVYGIMVWQLLESKALLCVYHHWVAFDLMDSAVICVIIISRQSMRQSANMNTTTRL